MLSSYPNGTYSTPALPPLKPNSASLSNAAFGEAADPPPEGATLGVAITLKALYIYKLLISPIFTGSCRFVPSCSEYAAIAVREHGVGKGLWLAVRRLARCQPLCHGGHDPVPPKV